MLSDAWRLRLSDSGFWVELPKTVTILRLIAYDDRTIRREDGVVVGMTIHLMSDPIGAFPVLELLECSAAEAMSIYASFVLRMTGLLERGCIMRDNDHPNVWPRRCNFAQRFLEPQETSAMFIIVVLNAPALYPDKAIREVRSVWDVGV